MPHVLTLWLFRPGNRSPEEEKDLPKVSQQMYVRPWNKISQAETRVSAAKYCLVSSVLSELPGPRCFGTSPDKDLLSLWLQHPRVPRANLNLFICCVTVVDLAANTWPESSWKDLERQGICLVWVDSEVCPLGFQRLMLPPCLLTF